MGLLSDVCVQESIWALNLNSSIRTSLAATEERSPTAANARGGAAALACGGLCGDGAARGELAMSACGGLHGSGGERASQRA
jgi:hypothetical protein